MTGAGAASRALTSGRSRGEPLLMLALLLGGWCLLRIMLWESPFAPPALAGAHPLLAAARPPPHPAPHRAGLSAQTFARAQVETAARAAPMPWIAARIAGLAALPELRRGSVPPILVASSAVPAAAAPQATGEAPGSPPPAPFLPSALARPRAAQPDRWSLDGWAFWRQGSNAAPVSLGRVPIYGASQAGAVLQYRLAPASRHDPRLYARAYRALVRRGESELALGASLRPLPPVPIRMAGEARYTAAAFRNTLRPAAYAITELPLLRLPHGLRGEAYGQAGWVGGTGATWFADGQASLTRSLPFAARRSDGRLDLSLGAGAWSGAQEGAERVDIGPTIRLDTRIGTVPARVSVDWRQRVAGDASPDSGVAVTVATGF